VQNRDPPGPVMPFPVVASCRLEKDSTTHPILRAEGTG
jgi:hypothetical protein